MKAFILDRYGKGLALRAGEVAEPEVREHDVLVEIHAAGVNVLDAKIRSGEFKLILPYRTPLVLGHDVAGVVLAVGARVTKVKPGDEIYARPADHHIGGFAQRIAIHEDDLALKPKNLSMVEAASVPLVGLTAWQALVEQGELQRGQKVFIQAGSGGVGTLAIQLAKHLGAHVATTAGAASFDLMRRLGADVVIDYKTEDFETKLGEYDLVLHSQDDAALEKSQRILRKGGRLVSISGPPDPTFAKDKKLPWYVGMATQLLSSGARRRAKKLDTRYSFLFMSANGEQLRQLASLFETGILSPVVDQVFPFDATNDALATVEAGRAKGKIVIQVK